jgi:hypothetical protein
LRAAFALQNDAAHTNQRDCNRIQPARQQSDEHGLLHRDVHGCAREFDGRTLVQSVPPLHRKIDDGHIHRADDGQQGGGTVGAARIIDGSVQGDKTKVQKQQDQFGSQTRIPYPPRSPHRLAPQRARPQRDEGEQRARRSHRGRHHGRQARVKNQSQGRIARHDEIQEHRQYRSRNVDEHDAVGLALYRIHGGDKEADVQTDHKQDGRRKREPRNQLSG